MAEIGDLPEATLLGSCKVDVGTVEKPPLENGNGIFLCSNMIFKRRVSARRDFPPRCGRHALEGDAKLRAESLFAVKAGLSTLKTSGLSLESELPKASVTVDEMEPSQLQNGLKLETLEVSSSSNQASSFEMRKSDMEIPAGSSMGKDSDQPLHTSALGDAEVKIAIKNFPTRKVSCTRHFPPGCGRNAPPIVHGKKSEEGLDFDHKKPSGDHPVAKEEKIIYANKNKSESYTNMESQGDVHPRLDSIEVKHEEDDGDVLAERTTWEKSSSTDAKENKENGEKTSDLHAKAQSTSQKVQRNVKSLAKETGSESRKYMKGSENVHIYTLNGDKTSDLHAKAQSTSQKVQREVKSLAKETGSESRKYMKGSENVHIYTLNGEKTSDLHSKAQSTRQKEVQKEVRSLAEETGSVLGKHKKGSCPDNKSEKTMCENVDLSERDEEESVVLASASSKMAMDTKISRNEKKNDLALRSFPKKKIDNNSIPKKKTVNSSMRIINTMDENVKKRKAKSDESVSRKKKKVPIAIDDDSMLHDNDDKLPLAIQECSLNLFPFGPYPYGKNDCAYDASPRRKVRETLRIFQSHCRKLLREDETKSTKSTQTLRADLVTAKLMKERNKCVNMGAAILGPVPGVEVGDEFHLRVELAIIGLHRPYQGGIDYTKQGRTILATSVVNSGVYTDDIDCSDVMIYSGQGGKPASGDKKGEDQKLERGNLALKNSIDAQTPVRVIHGYKESSTETRGKIVSTLTYTGLYLVEKYWQERSEHGCMVYKFQMKRLPGQPELAMEEVKKIKKSAVREGLCMKDISQGKEKKPICVVNTIDNNHPSPFKYVAKMTWPPWFKPIPPKGCDCIGGCCDSKNCTCVMKNGGVIPFNHNGAVVEAKPLVYECGPSCKCPPSCNNRVSQHGIKIQLEVFKTKERGWGVRSLNSIPSGSFVCEYVGELLKDKGVEQRSGNDDYLFHIGNNFNDQSLSDRSSPIESQSDEVGEYTIDAAHCGNVGRFINHSCSPNLYAQFVLYDHDDKSMPHVMFFAADNIPPLQELAYHYSCSVGQVHDSKGILKQEKCSCGSSECTGKLY